MTEARTNTASRSGRKPDSSPDKRRWMLWLPEATLARLRAESDRLGEPMAQIVRDATEARVALGPDQVQAYGAEAQRRGVPVAEVLRDALVDGTPQAAAA